MENQNFKRVAAGSVIGIFIALAGFFFATYGTRGMGALIFFLVPGTSGFIIGFTTRAAKVSAVSGMIALVFSLFLLIAMGKEGALCALMALVLIAVPIAIGAVLGIAVRALVTTKRGQNTTMGMFILVAPVFLVGAKHLEAPSLERSRIEYITDSIWVPGTIQNTWTDIQSIDSIRGSKPWLMHVGLPIPQRCAMQGQGVGARRTCYFDKGYIEETVTEWDPPRTLGLMINRTHMPGRHWLEFESAEYHLAGEGQGTRLSRTTVIDSHLYPAWYWSRLERWGISSEHRYILVDVAERARTSR